MSRFRESTIAGLSLAALLLTGCTAAQPSSIDLADAAADVEPGITQTRVQEIPEGVVATGTFVSNARGVGGEISIVHDGQDFALDVSAVTFTSHTNALLGLTDDTLEVGDCLGESAQAIVSLEQPVLELPEFEGDPSFFDSAVIVDYGDGTVDASGCARRILAAAPLQWTVPDMRPGLAPVDAGETKGAAGYVAMSEDGFPGSYTTASGDNLLAVATRFGMTVDDLNWLNPCRPGAYTRSEAYEGEVLNLSKAARGARLP